MLQDLRRLFKFSLHSAPHKSWLQNVLHVPGNAPLPEDIFRLLVEEYLEPDRSAIENLSLTCKAFALFSRQYIFREVCIGTPPNTQRTIRSPPTLPEVKRGVKRSPYLLDFIQVLRVYHPQGIVLCEYNESGAPNLNKDGKAFVYILLRVKHLRVLELPRLANGPTHKWSNLPRDLQNAIFTVFRMNASTLQEVSIPSHYPLQLVRLCTGTLQTLDYRVYSILNLAKESWTVDIAPDSDSAAQIAVQHLIVEDPFGDGGLIPYLTGCSFPIDVTGLKTLTYFGFKPPLGLDRIANLSASKLESLKVFIHITDSSPGFDFSMLSRLKHITLTIDGEHTWRGSFDWIPRSFKTFEKATSSELNSVELIIRARKTDFEADIVERRFRWVDTVMQQLSRKFATLKILRVECCVDKETWSMMSRSGAHSNLVEQVRKCVDPSPSSKLYTVEVAFVEDHFPRWTSPFPLFYGENFVL